MRRFLVISIVTFCTVARPALGEDSLSEERFLAALDEGHPAIAALMGRVAAARAQSLEARILPNPRLTLAREAPEGTSQLTQWSVAWTPPLDGRRGLRIDASEAGVRAAESDLVSARLRLRLELRAAYAAWALAGRRRDLAVSGHARVAELATLVEARARKGEESGLTSRRLALTAFESSADAARAEADLARARAAALGWRPDLGAVDEVVLPDLPEAPADIDPSTRPDLEARRAEARQAGVEARLSGRFIGAPELEVGWQKVEEGPASFDGPTFGLAWSLPIGDRQQGARALASRRLEIARAQLDVATLRARAELDGARAAYVRLRQAALEGLGPVAETDRVMEAALTSFRLGESGVTDLLETLRSVRSSRDAALDLYGAALEAHRDLEAASGRALSSPGSAAP
jgi:outer membrane protein TolC